MLFRSQYLVKKFDPSRLIHNERAAEPVSYQFNDFSQLDVMSRMYASFDEVVHFCENLQYTKPFMLCEYSHAMGNGPGDLKAYFDLMERYPAFVGGFVWEWADHGMRCHDKNGNSYIGYGGDFGETLHDGNFCVDGLTTPDREWTSKMREYRNIHLPIQLKEINFKTGECLLKNINSFLSGDNYQLTYTWHRNGQQVETGSICLAQFTPNSTKTFQVTPVSFRSNDTLTFEIQLNLKETGQFLGTQQKIIQEVVQNPFEKESSALADNSLHYHFEDNQFIIIEGKDFSYKINQQSGLFDEIWRQGENLLVEPSFLQIWRAPTDNDRNIRHEWEAAGYNRVSLNLISYDIVESYPSIIWQAEYKLGAPGIQNLLSIEMKLTIQATGEIMYQFDVRKSEQFPDLPRFGIVFPLISQFNKANYFGFGPFASYEDKHYASQLGEYTQTLDELAESYLYPQENGNRWHTHWVNVLGEHHQLLCTSSHWFNFSLQKYSAEMIKHAHLPVR